MLVDGVGGRGDRGGTPKVCEANPRHSLLDAPQGSHSRVWPTFATTTVRLSSSWATVSDSGWTMRGALALERPAAEGAAVLNALLRDLAEPAAVERAFLCGVVDPADATFFLGAMPTRPLVTLRVLEFQHKRLQRLRSALQAATRVLHSALRRHPPHETSSTHRDRPKMNHSRPGNLGTRTRGPNLRIGEAMGTHIYRTRIGATGAIGANEADPVPLDSRHRGPNGP